MNEKEEKQYDEQMKILKNIIQNLHDIIEGLKGFEEDYGNNLLNNIDKDK